MKSSHDLVGWVRGRAPKVAERWAGELAAAGRGWHDAALLVLEPFAGTMAAMLPVMITPGRVEILPLWTECASLFGSVAARRGLEVGEVIEEVHLMREIVLTTLHGEAGASSATLPLRELLLLNRAIDLAVTHANIGHTELLFFSLLRGSGIPAPLRVAEAEEVREEVGRLAREARHTMNHIAAAGSGSGEGERPGDEVE